jgi:hypothetical protein
MMMCHHSQRDAIPRNGRLAEVGPEEVEADARDQGTPTITEVKTSPEMSGGNKQRCTFESITRDSRLKRFSSTICAH